MLQINQNVGKVSKPVLHQSNPLWAPNVSHVVVGRENPEQWCHEKKPKRKAIIGYGDDMKGNDWIRYKEYFYFLCILIFFMITKFEAII